MNIDPAGKFNNRQDMDQREYIGILDQVVGFHGAKHRLGPRVFTARVCDIVMTELRLGIPSLQSAMVSVLQDEWTAKYALANFKYAPSGKIKGVKFSSGERYIAARTLLKDYRQFIIKPKKAKNKKPDTDGDEFLEFVLHALEGATDDGEWIKDYRNNSGKDNKNASLLCERYLTLTKAGGSSRMWLYQPPVWASVRVRLGDLFSPVEGKGFNFGDGLIAKPAVEYEALGDGAAATGYRAAENVEVLNRQSQTLEGHLKTQIEKVRLLLIDIAGIPGPADSPALPQPVFDSVMKTMSVSPTVCLFHEQCTLTPRLFQADFRGRAEEGGPPGRSHEGGPRLVPDRGGIQGGRGAVWPRQFHLRLGPSGVLRGCLWGMRR